MLFWIVAVLALYLVQLYLPSPFRIGQVGLGGYMGSRDSLPDLPVIGARAERAARNMAESLPFFLAVAVLVMVMKVETPMAMLGAEIFFFGRLVYLFTYLFAVPYIRSMVWTAAFAGIVVMGWPLLGVAG